MAAEAGLTLNACAGGHTGMSRPPVPKALFRFRATQAAFLATVAIFSGNLYSEEPSRPDGASISEKVVTVFRESLSTEVVEGESQRVIAYHPPSEWTLKSLRHLGDDAVPYIASHLRSADVRERGLAAQLLGNQGGTRIIAPLRSALHDPAASVRLEAVYSLTGAPKDLALDLLRDAATGDTDVKVREAAQKILLDRAK